MQTINTTPELTVAMGVESTGDAAAQNMRERAAAAVVELRTKAERALTHVKGVLTDLFNGRHTEAEQVLREAITRADGQFAAGHFHAVPHTVYRALQGAEAAVYQAESGTLMDSVEEIRKFPALQGLANAADQRLTRAGGYLAGVRPNYREAIRVVREGQAMIDRNLERPCSQTQPRGGGNAKAQKARKAERAMRDRQAAAAAGCGRKTQR